MSSLVMCDLASHDRHRYEPLPGRRAHLASWVGVCPGNNKTGGKSKPSHTRPGNRWLTAALGTAAMGAIRTRSSYANALFRRVAARRGGKRAQTAVAHCLLVAAWHVLATRPTSPVLRARGCRR